MSTLDWVQIRVLDQMAPGVDRPARVARVAALLIAVVGGVVLVWGLATHEPAPFNATALVASVEDEAGSAPVATGRCRATGEDVWSCTVSDPEGSGGGSYAVRRTSDHCWSARLLTDPHAGETPMPRTLDGCIS